MVELPAVNRTAVGSSPTNAAKIRWGNFGGPEPRLENEWYQRWYGDRHYHPTSIFARVAQWLEQALLKRTATGSSPVARTINRETIMSTGC
jgi:hypothetical protein